MPMSKYVVQPAEGAKCAMCRKSHLRLLIKNDGVISRRSPAFYLCDCGAVAETGVGPVTRVEQAVVIEPVLPVLEPAAAPE